MRGWYAGTYFWVDQRGSTFGGDGYACLEVVVQHRGGHCLNHKVNDLLQRGWIKVSNETLLENITCKKKVTHQSPLQCMAIQLDAPSLSSLTKLANNLLEITQPRVTMPQGLCGSSGCVGVWVVLCVCVCVRGGGCNNSSVWVYMWMCDRVGSVIV